MRARSQLHNIQYTYRKNIVKVLQLYVNQYQPYTIVDPFCGIPHVLTYLKKKNNSLRCIGSDIDPYIIAMQRRLAKSSLLSRISFTTYEEMSKYARAALKRHTFLHRTPGFPNWQIGCGLHLGSKKRNFENGYVGDEEYDLNRKFITTHGNYIRNKVSVQCMDYQKWEQLQTWKRYQRIVYCNYPVPDVSNHYNLNPYAFNYWFNLDEFLTLMEEWSEYHIVIISGKEKPNHFKEIWHPYHADRISERLFVHERWVID